MLFLSGLDHKTYWDRLGPGAPLPEIPCPDPACLGRLVRGHGSYSRQLGGKSVDFRRVRCPRCRVTHALLPEDVCAYGDLTLPVLEEVMEADGPTAAARCAGECDEEAVRRARRRRRARVWARLRAMLDVAGELWERIEKTVGSMPGKLVRLRHWLWRKKGYLLGGPCGLFRHGRPGLDPHHRSTQVGPPLRL